MECTIRHKLEPYIYLHSFILDVNRSQTITAEVEKSEREY